MLVRGFLSARRRLVAVLAVLISLAYVGFVGDHQATVAQVGTTAAVVGISKAASVNPTSAQIDTAVREAIAAAGGLPTEIGPGKKIVIQPNLVNAGFYSGGGVVTNAQVVKTIIQMCLEMGAAWDDITVCEGAAAFTGSAGGYTSRQMTRKALKDCGLDTDGDMFVEGTGGVHIAKCVDANYVGDYWGPGSVGGCYPNYPQYTGPYNTDYVTLYSKNPVQGVSTILVPELFLNRVYALPNCVVQSDVLIRVPALKNHELAGITGSLKLAYGHAPSDIYHYESMTYYKWRLLHYPDYWGYPEADTNGKGMADMTLLRPPDFVVLDGLVGITNGPCGSAIPSDGKMACIIAGADPVAVDTIQTLACSYSVASIYGLTRAVQHGLGSNDPGKIEVRGVHVKDIRRVFPAWGCAVPVDDPDGPAFALGLPDGAHVCGRLSISPTGCTDNVVAGKTGTGVCKGELYVDGVLVDSNDAAPYTTTWNVTNQSEGAHTITYTLYDKMLNETSASRTVYVHRNDPIAAAFGLADGEVVSVGGVVFSAAAPAVDASTFFVSSPDGIRGLRVRRVAGAPALAPGQRVELYGAMTTIGGQRCLNCTSYSAMEAGQAATPRFMRNADLGGTGYNAHTFGVTGGRGAYNLGCLVRTSGRVSAGGSDHFYVSDGSLAGDPSGAEAVKVISGTLPKPFAGSYVSLTGWSCCENDGGIIRRVLVLRSGVDWRIN